MNEAIKIFIRMRPRLQNEDEKAWKIQKDPTAQCHFLETHKLQEGMQMYSHLVYKIFASEEDIYLNCKQLLQYTLQGFNSCLFLHGQTTPEKKYINAWRLRKSILFKEYQLPIAISYIEIYNEQINDLLQLVATNQKYKIQMSQLAYVNQLRQFIGLHCSSIRSLRTASKTYLIIAKPNFVITLGLSITKLLSNSLTNINQHIFVSQFKDFLTKQLQDEAIFNNVYVQSILNPQSDFQMYQTQELMPILQSAFQEATNSLQLKLTEITSAIQQITLNSYQTLLIL